MSALQTRNRRRVDTVPKGGDKLVDDEIDDAFNSAQNDGDTTDSVISDALSKAMNAGTWFSLGRA